MRKAIQLRAILWIEGEQEPAQDFAAHAMQQLRALLERGAAELPELRMTVKRVEEDRAWDEVEEEQ